MALSSSPRSSRCVDRRRREGCKARPPARRNFFRSRRPLSPIRLFSRPQRGGTQVANTDTCPMRARSRAKESAMAHDRYQSCIDACNECATACHHCAAACLQEDDVSAMRECIRLDFDCAEICMSAAAFMSRGSAFAGEICSLCADVCDACAEECARHDLAHCRECAEACRRCADECRRMSAGAPGRRPARRGTHASA